MGIASDPKGRGIQVTIKYGKGYEETWVSFAGLPREIFDDIVDYFGLDPSETEGLTLSELVVTATNLAHAKGTLASTFGATVIPPGQEYKPAKTAPASDVWEQVGQAGQAVQAAQAAAEPVSEKDRLLKEIEAEATVDGLKRLYATSAQAFQDHPELLAAWKARGKALKGAA